jgi:hypothetical protein
MIRIVLGNAVEQIDQLGGAFSIRQPQLVRFQCKSSLRG